MFVLNDAVPGAEAKEGKVLKEQHSLWRKLAVRKFRGSRNL